VALAVDLPGDGGVLGADAVGAAVARGGTSVEDHVIALLGVDDHAPNEVGVVVLLVVDDGEDLGLDTDLLVGRGEHAVRAEDSVVEGGLVLVDGAAGASGRVGPVDLIEITRMDRQSKRSGRGGKRMDRQRKGKVIEST